MIDIRPSYWILPFIKWSQCARNSGQYSLAKPSRGIALANGELIETSDSWRKIRETTATFYREDVAHLMDAHETSERRDVDIGCCCMTVSYKQPGRESAYVSASDQWSVVIFGSLHCMLVILVLFPK